MQDLKLYRLTLATDELHTIAHAISDRCRVLRRMCDGPHTSRQTKVAAAEELASLEDIGKKIYSTLYPDD